MIIHTHTSILSFFTANKFAVGTSSTVLSQVASVPFGEFLVILSLKTNTSGYWSIEVHLKTSPLTPLLAKERGDEAQLYRGEVELYLSCLRKRYSSGYFVIR
jgi:hypothetical protein